GGIANQARVLDVWRDISVEDSPRFKPLNLFVLLHRQNATMMARKLLTKVSLCLALPQFIARE
ncbi:hypothetical protein BD310DRAFT_818261, partial [Dichomitus squalens]